MINNKKIIGIVPARIGSKGLKFKNIKKLNSKPLIFWPIQSLKKSKYVDKIVLNTDSRKIRNIGIKMGAVSPFLRPKHLASDNSKIADVIIHTIKFFQKKKIFYDYLLLLEPTSPLTTSRDIDSAIEVLEKSSKKFSRIKRPKIITRNEQKAIIKKKKPPIGITNDGNQYNIKRSLLIKKLNDSNIMSQAMGLPVKMPNGTLRFKIEKNFPARVFSDLSSK